MLPLCFSQKRQDKDIKGEIDLQIKDNSVDKDIENIIRKISGKEQPASAYKDSDVEFEIGEEKTPVPEKTTEAFAEPADEPTPVAESSLPDIFDLAEKEDGATISDDIFKIKTTYVPRFTDASDNFHRLGFIPEKEKPSPKAELVLDTEPLDPTAELDSDASADAKVVEVNAEKEYVETATTMFKFDGESEENISTQEKPLPFPAPEEAKIAEPEPIAETEAEPEAPAEESVLIEEPLVDKTPVRYVPKDVAPVENITGIGDEVTETSKTEISSSIKRDGFKDKFIDTILSQKVRFFVALAITAALLVFETAAYFSFDGMIALFGIETVPHALAVIDLQFAVCVTLLAIPEIVNALRSSLKKAALTELFLIPAFLTYLAYTVTVIALMPTEPYALFGLLLAVFALSAIASSYFRTEADFLTFKFISKQGDKKIVDNKYTRTLEYENMALDGVVDEYKSRTARVFRSSFIADFFRRTKQNGEEPLHIAFVSMIPLAVSLVTAVAVGLVKSSFLSAMSAFAISFLLSLPSFSILVRKLPHYHASVEALGENGAIIGERAFFEYAGVDVMCFEDTEIFDSEDVNIQRIRLYGNSENLTKALSQMSALFMNVGGPLDVIFSNSLDRKCAAANGVSIKDNGIIGEIDGKKVLAGSYEFMLSEGVAIPKDDDGESRDFDSTKIMYAAENGTVLAKFFIRYRFSEEFTMLMPILKDEGIVPLVYTRDPNVNNELLKKLTAGTYTMRILKKHTTPMRDFAPSKVSVGMVANGDKESLVNLVLLAKRYSRFNSKMKITERTAMAVGLALGVVLSISGMIRLPSFLLSVWQLGWIVALYVFSRSSFKLPKRKKEKKKNAK